MCDGWRAAARYARSVPATSLFWSLGLLGIIICAIAVAALVIPMFLEKRDDD